MLQGGKNKVDCATEGLPQNISPVEEDVINLPKRVANVVELQSITDT
jgi:hypothetical protein